MGPGSSVATAQAAAKIAPLNDDAQRHHQCKLLTLLMNLKKAS
jgi:hypothetical protein